MGSAKWLNPSLVGCRILCMLVHIYATTHWLHFITETSVFTHRTHKHGLEQGHYG